MGSAGIIRYGIIVVIATTLSACGKSQLTELGQAIETTHSSTQVTVNFCLDPAYVPKQNLKTIIVLDHSNSNQINYKLAADGTPAVVNGSIDVSATYATDPNGLLRYGATNTPGTLLNFLYTQSIAAPTDSTQRFYALVDFNSQKSTYPPNSSGFTSDIADFYQAVLTDSQAGSGNGVTKPSDGGATDYLTALQAVNGIITADVQAAVACAARATTATPTAQCPNPGQQVASSYVVVFMSDGAPITSITGVGQDANGNVVVTGPVKANAQSTTDILGQVATLASLSANVKFVTSVNFFTIYYYYPGNVDVNGQKLLAQMAQVGNGIAYNQLSGSSIDYSKFQPPLKRIKYSLADVFVTNASATWWGTKYVADLDRDGLPDSVETTWGTDPTKADSDGNGVSDFVEYQIAAGAPRQSVNYAANLCQNIQRTTVAGAITFRASDLSGLNDCEKLALNNVGGIGNADSNGDLIPDFLEYKSGLPFQLGTAPAINVRDQDGLTTYQKIKYGLPVNISTAQLLSPQPASYDLRMVSSTASRDCFRLNVSNLPTVTALDVVRVDVLEKSELLNQNVVYHRGLKSLGGGKSLTIDDWTSPAEITANTWGPQ